MKKNGFTLIELLASLVILGIVTTVAIQSYFVLSKNNDESKYNYYYEMIKVGADLFLENRKDSMESGKCYSVSYQTLVDKNFVKEEDITCTGDLMIRRDIRRYDYYDEALKCSIKSKAGKVLKQATGSSSGCTRIN